ncbi:hypothetical protein QQ045_021937 [Rhodiola kirilowii]
MLTQMPQVLGGGNLVYCEELDILVHPVEVTCDRSDDLLVCSFVYASIDHRIRAKLWDELKMISQQIQKPWIIVGDFNAITSWSEKRGGNRKLGRSITDFNDFMANVGVSDAGYTGSPFTWSNNQSGNSRIWLRLDRALLNGQAMATLQQFQVIHLARCASDHCPLFLYLKGAKNQLGRSFKFMGVWLEHKDFFSVVKSAWKRNDHPNPLINIAIKLKQTRSDLKRWNWE